MESPGKVCVSVCSIKFAEKTDGHTRSILILDRYAFPQGHYRTLQNNSALPGDAYKMRHCGDDCK